MKIFVDYIAGDEDEERDVDSIIDALRERFQYFTLAKLPTHKNTYDNGTHEAYLITNGKHLEI